MTHGMVIVPVITGKGYCATCLCGWWDAEIRMLDMAHYVWTNHNLEAMQIEVPDVD